MDRRKDSVSATKQCRFCLRQDGKLKSLYEKSRSAKNSLTMKILSVLNVEVFPSDKMPLFICEPCKFFMNIFYDFKQICRQADEKIFQYVQNGYPFTAIQFTPALLSVYQTHPQKQVVETVVESGATVQVSQDSDTDEEESNVYNVQTEDGVDKCVKVVTSQEGGPEETRIALQASLSNNCWVCEHCHFTFKLRQQWVLHIQQKHQRVKNFACALCETKFYTKYDLNAHAQSHSTETPFQCSGCEKRFKRLVLLKRHEERMHSDLQQLPCNECPESFISPEELEVHQVMHRKRRHTCHMCQKKFTTPQILQRHIVKFHTGPYFTCDYCPERFNTVSKLGRHVKNHAGERPYPCKFCNKSFTLSHHYTRHLRIKHDQSIEMEQFRCEECNKSFFSQDDLIFHSAIHTTQNLTCPLCQEKFEDVEAVTAHIKTHVNGVECMCDFCELVFTTKEKLDNHILMSHQDELNVQGEDNDESSMEMEREEDEEIGIKVKEENGEMVVEIKKGDFMLQAAQDDSEDKPYTEDSETEASMMEYQETELKSTKVPPTKPTEILATITPVQKPVIEQNQVAAITQKYEEVKRKSTQQTESVPPSKKSKPEAKPIVGASEKSLRLLEKELQELKRTNSRVEVKTPAKTVEMRNRRGQLHTSTPKPRPTEEKRSVVSKAPVPDRKLLERRTVTKENKEPKESKDLKELNNKDLKDAKESTDLKDSKEAKDPKESKDPKDGKDAKSSTKEEKEKELQKIVIKNGGNDKSASEESIRRSSRPSKVKDYARMIRNNRSSDEDDDGTTDDDEEYPEPADPQQKRRFSVKPTPVKRAPSPGAVVRKRGRPRKVVPKEEPIKNEEEKSEKEPTRETPTPSEEPENPSTPEVKAPDNQIVSPTGQTLKKVPIKALPPGVKPMPLPAAARGGKLCEMQIGKKMVKVQKIVMTKAEVEAMAKKGLLEMKGNTMVLKQGIKLPVPVNAVNKLPDVAEPAKKIIPAAPSRCVLGDENE